MKLNFLVVGDIHLEAIAKYFPEDYLSPVTDTLKNIWKYARENAIEHIVILGDIFDNPFPKDETKKAFLKSLDKKLQYHIILGNHDYANVNENSLNLCKYFIEDLGLMDNVKFYLKPTVEEIQGIKFNYLPYPQKQPTTEAPAICFGHFETKGAISDNGRPFKEGIVLDKNYNWFLGHLHRQQGDLYPGSILQCRFGEPVNKYFFDVKVNNDDSISIEKITINTPYKLLDLVIDKYEDLDSLDKNNVYRLYLSSHLDLGEVNKKCQGYNIWQIKGVSPDKKSIDLTEEEIQDLAEYKECSMLDELEYLKNWLEINSELTEEEITKALNWVEEQKHV